jgi:peptide/nickel transport system ATP-binding protein
VSTGPPGAAPLLEVDGLTVDFDTGAGPVRAVRGVSFAVAEREVVALVGESGSGKSATALAALGLLPRSAAVGGAVRFRGEDLLAMPPARLRELRGGAVSMVFQDPMTALTPVRTVGAQLAEAVRAHARVSRAEAGRRAVAALDTVGIPDAGRRLRAYPHEFSGGMRQRVLLAMAIVNDPALLVADEPTTALDVTVQALILDTLRELRERTGIAVVLITHDLGVVAGFADRALVMYAGRVVERAGVAELFARPRMPYTAGLLASVPGPVRGGRLRPIPGVPPSPGRLPAGCPFGPRCPLVAEVCAVEPPLAPTDLAGHRAACHRWADTGKLR